MKETDWQEIVGRHSALVWRTAYRVVYGDLRIEDAPAEESHPEPAPE